MQNHKSCNYRGKLRRIHVEVCKWHMEKKDPECVKRCGIIFTGDNNGQIGKEATGSNPQRGD